MRIILDAMSGDFPAEAVKGALKASKDLTGREDITLVLVGDEAKIREEMKNEGKECPKNIEILHTEDVLTMEDDPMTIMKEKRNSSMGLALTLLKEGADAMISAGNTGALHAGSSLIVRKLKGVRRSALATILPLAKPMLLMDCGANPVVTADVLCQWAILGSIYMESVMGVTEPRVGLLNNGAEEHKGTPVAVEAHHALKGMPVNFVGNVEGKEVPTGVCDVLVTDGFTGNILLKYTEGFGKFFLKKLKTLFSANFRSKLAYLLTKKSLMGIKEQFNASKYGGALFLGLAKPVIKSHGSSDAEAIRASVHQAVAFVEQNTIEKMADQIRRAVSSESKPAEA
ncbi:MAG: phosphate acyltransferase PlsX [Clostridia bacterium]|nr:phosphate acyltransferase PlsX [Clostridia bacterium]